MNNFYFAYSITAVLYHEEITYNPERISKTKPYISNHNWKYINFRAGQKEWKIFERNNKDIGLNIFPVHSTEKKINLIHKSYYNHKCPHIIDLLLSQEMKIIAIILQ